MGHISRRKVTFAAAIVLLAVAVPASANHVFSDVPADYVHHGAIAALDESGVTAGCAAGEYCPGDDVNRGQMASFLTRAGTTITADSSTTSLALADGAASGVPVTVEVDAPGTDGTQRVTLEGTVTVRGATADAGCPCDVEAFVYRLSDDEQGASSLGVFGTAADGAVTLPVSWSVPIPAGSSEEFHIAVFVEGSTSELTADGTLTAVTAPFGDVAAP